MWSGYICGDADSFADNCCSSQASWQHSFHINKYDFVFWCRTEQRCILYPGVSSKERSIVLLDRNS